MHVYSSVTSSLIRERSEVRRFGVLLDSVEPPLPRVSFRGPVLVRVAPVGLRVRIFPVSTSFPVDDNPRFTCSVDALSYSFTGNVVCVCVGENLKTLHQKRDVQGVSESDDLSIREDPIFVNN